MRPRQALLPNETTCIADSCLAPALAILWTRAVLPKIAAVGASDEQPRARNRPGTLALPLLFGAIHIALFEMVIAAGMTTGVGGRATGTPGHQLAWQRR